MVRASGLAGLFPGGVSLKRGFCGFARFASERACGGGVDVVFIGGTVGV